MFLGPLKWKKGKSIALIQIKLCDMENKLPHFNTEYLGVYNEGNQGSGAFFMEIKATSVLQSEWLLPLHGNH